MKWLLFILPFGSILWRVLYRGYHYAGWEIYAATKGLLLIKDFGFIEATKIAWFLTRNCLYCGIDGFILGIIPGTLYTFLPWEFWPHLLTFLMFSFSFWLCGISLQLKGWQWSLLALALSSSATLMSYSIMGSQHVSGFLPHSLALFIIFHPKLKKNWWVALILGFITIEISWHVYPLGRTIFVPFILAGLFLHNTTIRNRIVHLCLGAISAFLVLQNTHGRVINSAKRLDNLIPITFDNFLTFLNRMFWDPGMDLFVILVLGLVSLLLLKKNRLLFAGILLSQWSLVTLLGFHGFHQVCPRRLIIVIFYSIVVVLVALKQRWDNKIITAFFTVALICGSVWQLANLYQYTKTDIHDQRYSLPYTFAGSDYRVKADLDDSATAIANLVKNNKKIILVYNYYSYQENKTDPEKFLERIGLKVGYDTFKDNVLIFTTQPRHKRLRWMPTISITKIEKTLNEMKNLKDYLVVEYSRKEVPNFSKEREIIMEKLRHKFTLKEQDKIGLFFNVYKIFPPGNQVTLKAKDTSSMELPEDFYSSADGAPFLIETASDANTVAWLRFVDAQETFYGHPYHWLSKGVLSLIIDIKPQKGQALELLWGAKNDHRTATLVVNGKPLALKAGEYRGFRWLRIPLPEFPTAKQYKITIKPDQTPVAFIAEVRLTATKADLGRPDLKIPAYKVSSSTH